VLVIKKKKKKRKLPLRSDAMMEPKPMSATPCEFPETPGAWTIKKARAQSVVVVVKYV
jgi:hypothetical protein